MCFLAMLLHGGANAVCRLGCSWGTRWSGLRRLWIFRAVVLTAPAALISFTAQSAVAAPQALDRQLVASRAVTAPVIDGVVDEQEWAGAAVADQFIQYQPQLGELTPRFTQALRIARLGGSHTNFCTP